MADQCILAGQAVMQAGSDELKAAAKVMLFVLGREIAARSSTEGGIAASVSVMETLIEEAATSIQQRRVGWA